MWKTRTPPRFKESDNELGDLRPNLIEQLLIRNGCELKTGLLLGLPRDLLRRGANQLHHRTDRNQT